MQFVFKYLSNTDRRRIEPACGYSRGRRDDHFFTTTPFDVRFTKGYNCSRFPPRCIYYLY